MYCGLNRKKLIQITLPVVHEINRGIPESSFEFLQNTCITVMKDISTEPYGLDS